SAPTRTPKRVQNKMTHLLSTALAARIARLPSDTISESASLGTPGVSATPWPKGKLTRGIVSTTSKHHMHICCQQKRTAPEASRPILELTYRAITNRRVI